MTFRVKNIHPNQEVLILDIRDQRTHLKGNEEETYIETDEAIVSYEEGSIRRFIEIGWIQVLDPPTSIKTEVNRTAPFLGDETPVDTTSSTASAIKEFTLLKNEIAQVSEINGLRLVAELKSEGAASSILEVYIGSEITPRAVMVCSSATYQLAEVAYMDVSDLDEGSHTVTFKLRSSIEGTKVYNKTLEIYIVR